MKSPAQCASPALAEEPGKPFRLVNDFQAGYLKFNGREPRTLHELALARAEHDHRRRLAEIKAMAKKLTLLDEHLPALAARGITLGHRDITTWDHGKTLRFTSALSGTDNKFFDALIALGFKEIERKDSFRDEQQVTVKHGRALLISFDVKKPAVATPAAGAPA